jgi:hypothetical protein
MHWFGAAVVPPGIAREDIEPYVEKVMAASCEGTNPQGVWDWWQVGGRWTGVWGEYDPTTDPRNSETCKLCNGTGRRPDAERFGPAWMESTGGCNGCKSGTAAKWPTQWAAYDGDIITVTALLNNPPLRRPTAVFLPGGSWKIREWWDGEEWRETAEDEWPQVLADALEPHRGQSLVVVDFHS